ncbi:DUF5134 domain-containing protein [Streptomyces sp. NBC_00005]|uniref:DUF5134 domain-containing protein n=1 Tax=Streptomyces sp. NBC_00005 TaxID=2903609 RepID=UPI00324C8D72
MCATDVVSSLLTVLFAAAAVHALRRRVLPRSPGRRRRVDGVLHTVMAVAMAAMLWGGEAMVPARVQVAFFVGAALWFPVSALSRRHGTRLSEAARNAPSAVGMAAMAWMARPMVSPGHHALAAAHAGHPMGEQATHGAGTGVLVLCLLAYALRSLTRDMPGLRRSADDSPACSTKELYGHFWEGATHLGTVVMLLMHP